MNRFEIYLPPTWARIDLVNDAEDSVRRFVNGIVRTAPPTKQPALRTLMAESIEPGLRAFADQGAVCLLTPSGAGITEPVRPMVVVRPLDLGDELDPLVFLQIVAGEDPSARVVDVPGMVAVRTESREDVTAVAESLQPAFDAAGTAGGDQAILQVSRSDAPDTRMISARVRYLMGVPDDADRWVDVQCAVDFPSTSEGAFLAEEALELVDAFLPTFRWVS